MLPEKKKSSRRLSSLFSLGSASDSQDGHSSNASESSGRLSKVKNRIASATHLAPDYPPPAPPNHASYAQPTIQPVESTPDPVLVPPIQTPPAIATDESQSSPTARSSLPPSQPTSQPTSRPGSRPGTPNAGGLQAPNDSKLRKLKRRSGLFGSQPQIGDERVNAANAAAGSPLAWIVGHRGKVSYNLTMLLNGEKVSELWDEQGDTLIYLFPRTSGKGPSFRVDSSVYAASQFMTRLVHGRLYSDATTAPQSVSDPSQRSVSAGRYIPSRSGSPDQSVAGGSSDGSKGSRALSDATEDDHSEQHLYLPIQLSTDHDPITANAQELRLSPKDIDTLVTYRNFVAFLIGQSLVATERHSDLFDIFMRIADVLQHYQFSNVDGSSYGEVAASSFDSYVDELNIADVRGSREKTIEALVLGERMRSLSLYTEGFVHAAGKYDSIKELQHPKVELVSHKTVTRLGRASLDLELRVQNINTKLTDFDFPGLFSGLMISDTSDEKKMIKFKNWRSAFSSTRSFAIDYYKSKYGSWLPKARSKKNNLTTSGLSRLVLLDLYRDLSNLYDLLVDRTNLTTRTVDGFTSEDDASDFDSIARRALRKILSEYDRSTPPVQPPIPFDLPLYPSPKSVGDSKKDAKVRSRKLKSDEVAKLLKESHNSDAEHSTPFLDAFRKFEQKQAHGCTPEELWELRSGQWMFLYAVIQSLPMLVVDAPGVKFTESVEYFLCEPPRSGVPWGREDTSRTRTWFGVAGGSQVVSLPTDVVEHGVEGIFRRSHCWKMAEKWSQNDAMLHAAVEESLNSAPLPPPPGGLLSPDSAVRSRSQSPDRRRESVMNLGLEALPLPTGGPSSPLTIRPSSSNDPNKTFDAILGSSDLGKNPKDKKNKKKK